MCGIFGAVKFGRLFEREVFDRFVGLTDLVSYRGPDDSGYVALDSASGRASDFSCEREPFNIFLGHRRLSIIDLSSVGHQPMTDGHGRWIIFNGEIFNFVELREEFRERGYEFRTKTDTEVILRLYEAYGESGFGKLNGMWALAIADLPARRIVISRDRFSIKPLYLLSREGELYFASEIKQLLPLLSSKEPNLSTLSNYLAQGLFDHSPETFFRGITRVPAKCNIVVSLPEGKTETTSYWNYQERPVGSFASACEEFHHLVLDSTRIRLRSDVKVGLLLSGGLDSSSIAVAVKQLGEIDLETFSVVSSHERFSEEPFIDQVTQHLSLKSNKIVFQLPNIEKTLKQALYHSDEPFGGLSVVAQYRMFERIRSESGARVLLSGQGGDEILLGYLKFFFFYVRQLLRSRRYVSALTQVLQSICQRTAMLQFRLSEAKRYMPSARFKNRSALRGDYAPIPIWNVIDLRSRQISDIDMYSVPALAHYEDRNSMAYSLEIRYPFLDHRLVNFALSVPPGWQLAHGWTKNLLRQSFPELPKAIRWRRDKQGFVTPEEHWLRHELADFIEHTFKSSLLEKFGLFDCQLFLQQFRSFRKGGYMVSFGDISRALIAELWAQQHWN